LWAQKQPFLEAGGIIAAAQALAIITKGGGRGGGSYQASPTFLVDVDRGALPQRQNSSNLSSFPQCFSPIPFQPPLPELALTNCSVFCRCFIFPNSPLIGLDWTTKIIIVHSSETKKTNLIGHLPFHPKYSLCFRWGIPFLPLDSNSKVHR
jgi:hypothetical protein